MDINQLLSNVDKVNFNEIIEDSLFELSPKIVSTQKDQLIYGFLSTGQKTGTYKNPKYAAKKFDMNPLAGFRFKDYKLTGAFQAGIFVDVRQTELVFGSDDPKTEDILNSDHNDGDNILGLSPWGKGQIAPQFESIAVDKIESTILFPL